MTLSSLLREPGVEEVLALRGPAHLRRLAFPLAFALLALPMPKRVEEPLQSNLQEWTAAVAGAALPWLGVPAAREGFVLALPSGKLGVIEACSGLRAVTAVVAAAALLGHLRNFRPVRMAALAAAALPVIALANALRVVLTGVGQERPTPLPSKALPSSFCP